MNVRGLKELLEDLDDDTEVRFASQPSWPFEYDIADAQVIDLNLPTQSEIKQAADEGVNIADYGTDGEDGEYDSNPVLYLVEGNQLGYLPGIVAETIGWR